MDSVAKAAQAHMDGNLAEYKAGSLSDSFSTSTEPDKILLNVGFEYSHNGKLCCIACISCAAAAATETQLQLVCSLHAPLQLCV